VHRSTRLQSLICLVLLCTLGCVPKKLQREKPSVGADPTEDAGGIPDASKPTPKPTDMEPEVDGGLIHEDPVLAPGYERFSVWAPYADAVDLVGAFHGDKAQAMHARGDGTWMLDVKGVADGDHYHFAIHSGDETLKRLDPRARGWDEAQGRSVVVRVEQATKAERAFVRPRPEESIIYELHPGAFFANDSGEPGTLLTAVKGLDHLADLGVNVIELMPVHEFPGSRSWGYNPDLPFVVESTYGGPKALRTFVSEAHKRGIAVLLDVVYNHLNGKTPLCRFDGWSLLDACGGVYFYNDERGMTDWGPRPDFGRIEVRDYLRDNVSMWLNDYRLDGLRFDSTSNMWNTKHGQGAAIDDGATLLRELNDDIDAVGDGYLSIAEDLHAGSKVTQSTEKEGFGFDSQWDPAFHGQLIRSLVREEGTTVDLQSMVVPLTARFAPTAFSRVIFTESHDTTGQLNSKVRLPNEVSPDDPTSDLAKRRTLLGAFLLFTAPGVPMILQGQELLADGTFHDSEALDWARLSANSDVFAVYKALIRARRNLDGNTAGLTGGSVTVTQVNQRAGVLTYQRKRAGGAGDDVMVAVNTASKGYTAYRLGVPRAGAWQVRVDSALDGSASTGSSVTAEDKPYDGLPFSIVVALAPESGILLSQNAK